VDEAGVERDLLHLAELGRLPDEAAVRGIGDDHGARPRIEERCEIEDRLRARREEDVVGADAVFGAEPLSEKDEQILAGVAVHLVGVLGNGAARTFGWAVGVFVRGEADGRAPSGEGGPAEEGDPRRGRPTGDEELSS
jgi:hypothetical protein